MTKAGCSVRTFSLDIRKVLVKGRLGNLRTLEKAAKAQRGLARRNPVGPGSRGAGLPRAALPGRARARTRPAGGRSLGSRDGARSESRRAGGGGGGGGVAGWPPCSSAEAFSPPTHLRAQPGPTGRGTGGPRWPSSAARRTGFPSARRPPPAPGAWRGSPRARRRRRLRVAPSPAPGHRGPARLRTVPWAGRLRLRGRGSPQP